MVRAGAQGDIIIAAQRRISLGHPFRSRQGLASSLRVLGVTRQRRDASRCAPMLVRLRWKPVASDGRKNDGHKYRSYLCFMTWGTEHRRQGNSENPRQSSNYRQPDPDRCPLAQCIPLAPSRISERASERTSPVLGRDSRDFLLFLLPTVSRRTPDP